MCFVCALDLYFLQHLVYHEVTFMSLVLFLRRNNREFNSSTLVIKSLRRIYLIFLYFPSLMLAC